MPQRPLSLKRERAKSSNRSRIAHYIADILVENDVLHLQDVFSYGIPDSIKETVVVGSMVKVPWRNSEKLGVVVAIREAEESVKAISKVINSRAFSQTSLELAEEVAHRYGSSQLEILNFVPSKSTRECFSGENVSRSRAERKFIAIREDSFEQLISHLESVKGGSLVLLPTEREASWFFEKAIKVAKRRYVKYFGLTNAKLLKEAEDLMRTQPDLVVVACRGGVFLQIANLTEVIVVDEQAEDYWESRRPYWNVRDVALIRSRLEGLNLTFLSGAPSLELTRLIEIGYVKPERRLPRLLRRNTFRFDKESYIETIRQGLKNGPVLVAVAEKSYSGSFICAKCRTAPACECGALLRSQVKGNFDCKVCGFNSLVWRCNECGNSQLFYLRKGAERIYEELGKSFPQISILISTAEKPISAVTPGSIVIATPGMQPMNLKYGGLVLLDGWLFLNRPGLKGEEFLRKYWFRLLAQMRTGGHIYVSLPSSHQISQDLISDHVLKGSGRQLSDRRSTKLPPWYRVILVSGPNVSEIAQNLKSEHPSIELARTNESSAVVIRARVEETQSLIDSLSALQRYRSASRRELLRIQIDPYDF